jgi:hypothetical protein
VDGSNEAIGTYEEEVVLPVGGGGATIWEAKILAVLMVMLLMVHVRW